MDYKVNVRILGKTPGQIVTPKDKDHERFAYWAKRGDKKSGMIICEEAKADTPKADKKPEKMNKSELVALLATMKVVASEEDNTKAQLLEMVKNPPAPKEDEKPEGDGKAPEGEGGEKAEGTTEEGTSDNEKQASDTGE